MQAPNHFAVEGNLDLLRNLSKLPTKSGGLALPDPTETNISNSSTSRKGTDHLTKSLMKEVEWNLDTHKETMIESKNTYKAEKLKKAEDTYTSVTSCIPSSLERTISRGKKSGAWLSAIPSEINGTCLGIDEC